MLSPKHNKALPFQDFKQLKPIVLIHTRLQLEEPSCMAGFAFFELAPPSRKPCLWKVSHHLCYGDSAWGKSHCHINTESQFRGKEKPRGFWSKLFHHTPNAKSFFHFQFLQRAMSIVVFAVLPSAKSTWPCLFTLTRLGHLVKANCLQEVILEMLKETRIITFNYYSSGKLYSDKQDKIKKIVKMPGFQILSSFVKSSHFEHILRCSFGCHSN